MCISKSHFLFQNYLPSFKQISIAVDEVRNITCTFMVDISTSFLPEFRLVLFLKILIGQRPLHIKNKRKILKCQQ